MISHVDLPCGRWQYALCQDGSPSLTTLCKTSDLTRKKNLQRLLTAGCETAKLVWQTALSRCRRQPEKKFRDGKKNAEKVLTAETDAGTMQMMVTLSRRHRTERKTLSKNAQDAF